jgi:hypothetical protein
VFAILGVEALRIKLCARRIFYLRAVFLENGHVLIGLLGRLKLLKRLARRHDPDEFKRARAATGHPTADAPFYSGGGPAGRD